LKKKLLLFGGLLIVILWVSALSAAGLALTSEVSVSGKGAAAQWNVVTPAGDHIINVYVIMDGNGQNAQMYVSIDHHGAVSAASGPATVQWSMNHVNAEATLTFTSVIGAGRTGTHNITVSWLTKGGASNEPLSINLEGGLAASVDGTWKSGAASLTLDPTATAGHHIDNTYDSDWGAVFFGDVDLSMTFPSTT
jgi:hypothetical protein